MTRLKVLLDTNVWVYIVNAGGVEAVRKAAKSSQVSMVVSPAVVFECLRTADVAVRKERAKALTRGDWVRLMPEAFSESEDLRSEMQRLRPEWFVERPDLRQWRRLLADWRGGFWRRVRSEPAMVAGQIKALGDDQLEQAREASRAARLEAQSLGQTTHTFKWDRSSAIFAKPTPGWDGAEFEGWRAPAVDYWWKALILKGSLTHLEWLGPWLDLGAIRSDPASWTRFWTREVEASALPREWIRWAMAALQATRSISSGTPGDNQLATYLIEVDEFITNDKVFADLVDAMRPHCPAKLAELHRSPTGTEAVSFVADLLRSLT